MKKIILILTLIFGVISYGQNKYPPIKEYNENGYTVFDLKDFIFEKNELVASFRNELVSIINRGLLQSGESSNINEGEPLTEAHLNWIISKTNVESGIKLEKGFINSRNRNNKVDFYESKKSFLGSCFIFNFGKCHLIFAKTICMNLLKIKVQQNYTVLDQINPSIKKEDLSKNKDTILNGEVVYITKNTYINMNKMINGYNESYYNNQFYQYPYQYRGSSFSFRIGYNGRPQQRGYRNYRPYYRRYRQPRRTMPGGIGSGNHGNGGGIPSNPRRMPGGIRGR